MRRSFPTLAAAKQWRQDAVVGVRRGTIRAATSLTLAAAADAWLDAIDRGEILARTRQPYKPSTVRGYRHDLATYVLPDLGALKLADVRADDLQALVDRLVGVGLSGSKVRNVLVPVQALYRRHRREVTVDPTDGLDLPAAGARRERAATRRKRRRSLTRSPTTCAPCTRPRSMAACAAANCALSATRTSTWPPP